MPETLTPKNQYPHSASPNQCPWCGYWHPVASITSDHMAAVHPGLTVAAP